RRSLLQQSAVDGATDSLPRRAVKRKPVGLECWRRGRDSNPRYPCGYNGFRDRPDRPLWHLSVDPTFCRRPPWPQGGRTVTDRSGGRKGTRRGLRLGAPGCFAVTLIPARPLERGQPVFPAADPKLIGRFHLVCCVEDAGRDFDFVGR